MTPEPHPQDDDQALRRLLDAESSMRAAVQAFPDCTLEDLTHILSDVAPGLAAVARAVSERAQDVAGEKAGAKTVEVLGVTWERSQQPPKRTGWQTDELLARVRDSRRTNEATGEIIEETPVEQILHVWSLGAPRTTALAERGIDPDEFCHKTWPDDMPWRFVPAVKKQSRRRK